MGRYGIPYKGSKNKIAEWVVDNLPPSHTLYDLFCGGCAITHCAMERGKYGRYVINDIDEQLPRFFWEAAHGEYRNEHRWISREDFKMWKDSDPYIRYLWSFGNNGKNYLYSEQIEPIMAEQWAIYFAKSDEERWYHVRRLLETISGQIKEATKLIAHCRTDEYADRMRDAQNEVEEVKKYLRDALEASGITQSELNKRLGTQMCGHYFGNSQWALPTEAEYVKMRQWLPLDRPYSELAAITQSLQSLQSLESLQRLQRLESLQRLQSLERLQSLQSLERFCCPYDVVEIEDGAVVYCDIPYLGTDDYVTDGFDHGKFYDWVRNSPHMVVVSEYRMPIDFVRVASVSKDVTLSGTGGGKKAVEGLFVHESKVDDYFKGVRLL